MNKFEKEARKQHLFWSIVVSFGFCILLNLPVVLDKYVIAKEHETKMEVIIDNKYERDIKGPVIFNHSNHIGYEIACIECHHDMTEGCEVKHCIECHKPDSKDVLKLKNAYHKNCKDCHKELDKGPYKKCNDCHSKKE